MIVPVKLPHFVSIAPDGVPEFFLDHTLLSTFRMCEARFQLEHLENQRPKALPWALDFGSLFHECMEWYYKRRFFSEIEYELKDFLEYGAKLWRDGNYDKYNTTPQYKSVGGFPGFVALLTQYSEYYSKAGDNLKPIALEIAFGKNKEVPILENHLEYSFAPFRLYLAGRMDFIFDDGRRLGPLDHKTFSRIDKNPMQGYEIQEGMTGYVYAMNYIYKTHFSSLVARDTDRVWMNFIYTGLEADLNKKFQRVPLIKTEAQLEAYRLRQISTCAKIYQVLFEGRPPDYNGGACNNWYHGTCMYHQVHRLSRVEDQLIVLQKEFKHEVWNPEAI